MIRNLETPEPVRNVLIACAAQHGVHIGAMTAKTREASVVAARRSAARTLSDQGHSTPAIGRYLGGLHHTAILHLLKTPGPARRRIHFPIPRIRVGEALAEDLMARLAEVEAHRTVLRGKLVELDDVESRIRLMMETLKPQEDANATRV